MTKRIIRKIIYGILALIFLLLCLWGYRQVNDKSEKQVDILFLGDSLVGQYRNETSIPYLLGEKLGLSVFNGALGGTSATRVRGAEDEFFQLDGVSLASLSYALANDDFRVPQATVVRKVATEHFPAVVDELEQIKMEKLEYLLIEYGTNDYYAGVQVENPEDPFDEYTYAGSLRSALKRLKKSFPEVRIILLSPTYSWYLITGDNCETVEFGGGYLKDYVDVVAAVAEEFDVEYLDLYTDLFPGREYEAAGIYTSDGLHPNEAGREKIAEVIAEFIRKNKE
ncbi:MAG: SGNH/GDSL hydrolase family protein [Lachnospiraceae bacterium]|nr:SGNH/GDSL hydrolase family protein [Lachnospiraceae bacterium]